MEKLLLQLKKRDLQEKKHDASYPYNAIEFVLKYANLRLSEVDQIFFFEKPFLNFERLLETYVAFALKDLVSFSKQCHYGLKKIFKKILLLINLKGT
jgi:carbamoyltransferase